MRTENDRAAEQLIDDYMILHRRFARAKKMERVGKQPRRKEKPVHVWRAPDASNGNRKANVIFG